MQPAAATPHHDQHVAMLCPHFDCAECHAFAATAVDPDLEEMANDDTRNRAIYDPPRPANAPRLGRFVLLDIRDGRCENTTPWSVDQIAEGLRVTMWRHRFERQRILGTCRQCGEPMSQDGTDGYVSMHKPSLSDAARCFDCEFWEGHATRRYADHERVVVDGCHMLIAAEPGPTERRSLLGHGGVRFHFRFHDGHEVVSHNVWYQGTIPAAWRDRLPDNAVRVVEKAS